ncbi:hypothetical protein EDD17DRAFT_1504871 [Pisolithus thermaeus]|nr:hypothetical protein EDD17DRAFT_1504871 [Pisolithus thermaeus]
MSNLEGTEHVKEGEKNRQEAVKREWRAGAHQQKAEEVQHKAAEEKVEHKEHERQEWACEECKEKERWEAIKAACWAVVMEAENVCARKVIAYSPTTGANIEMLLQTEGGDSWAIKERAGMGSLWGEGRKKGQPNEDDDNEDDDEVTEVPALVGPHSQAAYLCLVGEMLVMGASVNGVPEPLYDKESGGGNGEDGGGAGRGSARWSWVMIQHVNEEIIMYVWNGYNWPQFIWGNTIFFGVVTFKSCL